MDIELLNQMIIIQKSTVITDAIGNRLNAWTNYHTCHCTVSGEGKGEAEAAGTTVDHSDTDFTVRWCNAVKVITPDGYRVLFGGDAYNIVGIDHMNYKRKCIKLKCRRERG